MFLIIMPKLLSIQRTHSFNISIPHEAQKVNIQPVNLQFYQIFADLQSGIAYDKTAPV